MEILAVIVGLAILGILYYLFLQLKAMQKPADESAQKLLLDVVENLRKSVQDGASKNREELQTRLDKITQQLTEHQHRSLETMQKQFGQSAKIIEEVTKKLTKLDETNKQVVGFAEQMKSLENILKNPKQRGILGEYLLETLLSNVLTPAQFQMQYSFKNGEIVDSVIFFNGKIIPIDAKFSLEKYNRIMQENDKEKRTQLEKDFKSDLKNRIDETSKYIRPQEDTTDFAFMFMPAEGIYYSLLVYNVGTVEVNTQDLIEYAFKKHVIIVSPTSFFAYLETVLHGLKALKMEASVQEIIKKVGELGRHLGSYETYLAKLGDHLGTTVSMYNQASKEFKKVDKDVYKITDGTAGGHAEVVLLDKPLSE
ncbi:MAG: DNA recombination protein RmuC [Candidatus Gracilibacteria bacterium]|jgi:DNA recombination protein RmuC